MIGLLFNKKVQISLLVLFTLLLVGVALIKNRHVTNIWNVSTLGEIPAPPGYERVEAPEHSYAAFLRKLPLKPRGSQVYLYTGVVARNQSLAAAVIDWPVLSNSEQCADMTMRIRAEYLWQSGQYEKIVFTDTQNNKRFYWGGGCKIALYAYLKKMYECCNTASVYNETTARPVLEVQPGDVLVYPARPGKRLGHAVLVADVAKAPSGQVAILCVEGCTPAREAHLVNPRDSTRSPWFFLDGSEDVVHISAFRFYLDRDELRYY